MQTSEAIGQLQPLWGMDAIDSQAVVCLSTSVFGKCTGLSFINATSIKVCHNRRIASQKVFTPLAARGKTSVDWFFGFKLHLVINKQGELLNVQLAPGNVDNRKPVPQLLQRLFALLIVNGFREYRAWQRNSGTRSRCPLAFPGRSAHSP